MKSEAFVNDLKTKCPGEFEGEYDILVKNPGAGRTIGRHWIRSKIKVKCDDCSNDETPCFSFSGDFWLHEEVYNFNPSDRNGGAEIEVRMVNALCGHAGTDFNVTSPKIKFSGNRGCNESLRQQIDWKEEKAKTNILWWQIPGNIEGGDINGTGNELTS